MNYIKSPRQRGLTEEEAKEQHALRQEYLECKKESEKSVKQY